MSAFRRLLSLHWPHRRSMLAGIGLNVVVTVSNVGLLALSGWFIAAMALAGLGTTPIEYFAPAAAIRGLAVVRTAGRYGERLVTHDATLRALSGIRTWFFASLVPLAPARLEGERGGDLLSRIRADVDSLDNLYLRVAVPACGAAASGVVLVLFLALFSPAASLLLLASLLAAGVALPLGMRRLGLRSGEAAVAARAALRNAVADTLRGLGELAVDGALPARARLVAGHGRALIAAQRREARLASAGTALAGLVASGALAGALVLLIGRVRAGTLSGPDLAMAAFFVLASFEAVTPLPAALEASGETGAAARRLFALADRTAAVTEPAPGLPAPARHDLRIAGLVLRYGEAGPPALDGIDLDVAEGTRLGIVGASGAGKSSLFEVLLRFREPSRGTVRVGGVPLGAMTGDTARTLFSVVAQRTHLFNATVRENLLLARPAADEAALWEALSRAHLADPVAALPDGLDTVVGENGARFSGGEARRLAVARAFLKDAPILLLDEPTAGLDKASASAVLDGLLTLMGGGRTTLLITHDPRALRDMDAVVRLERGRIVSRAAAGTAVPA